MRRLGVNELRKEFLDFFESKGHLILASSPLVPKDDPSLLLINSGMAPLKPYFTGAITPPRKRVTTCQKCIRTPDIERVGKTARHGTFFEMLGNFSFGDYFKDEATAWAWEFATTVIKIPVEKLWITIYEEDDETKEVWLEKVGVSSDRIVKLGKEDNFWEHGLGPCGPCSELYYDRGESYSCGESTCAVGCDCDRYVEFWNLVFTQFDKDEQGNYNRLSSPNIDTGMGLERLACIVQGVDNIFEIDTIADILNTAAKYAGIKYKDDEKNDVSLRVITDHIRGATFMIGDGVIPSNEGRGYVLRRLLRRAARHGWLLGLQEPFLNKLTDKVIEHYGEAYPELVSTSDYIKKIILLEEQKFLATVAQGLSMLDEQIANMKSKVLEGEIAFTLYDTFGFPLDLTQDILEEKGLSVDSDTFNKCMQEQREKARNARKDDSSWDTVSEENKDEIAVSDAHMRAHSGTHILQAALRKIVGTHVEQKGSYVGEDHLRFDFSHFEALTDAELKAVTDEVNANILKAMSSDISEKTIAEAKEMGAMALFGEKYGDKVRVVKFGDVSIELCSGRHVGNTGEIGLFYIVAENGSAAGVRRIEAYTGLKVLEEIGKLNAEISDLKEKNACDIKEFNKKIKELKLNKNSDSKVESKVVDGIVISKIVADTSDIDILKSLCDDEKAKNELAIVAVGGADDEGVKFVVGVADAAVEKGFHAGKIVKEIANVAGGNGGGKPNFAQAGGTDKDKLNEALDKVFEVR